jgi:hypothetical protein
MFNTLEEMLGNRKVNSNFSETPLNEEFIEEVDLSEGIIRESIVDSEDITEIEDINIITEVDETVEESEEVSKEDLEEGEDKK